MASSGNARIPYASSQDRTLAYMLDASACGLLLALLVLAFEGYCNSKAAGAALYACIVFFYQFYNLNWRAGITFGKYVRNIQPVDATGQPLAPVQCLVRALMTAMPFFLMGTDRTLPSLAEVRFGYARLAEWGPLAGLLLLGVDVYILEFHRRPRTLTDRLSRTLVITLPPPQPHRAPAFPMYSRHDAEFGHRPDDGEKENARDRS